MHCKWQTRTCLFSPCPWYGVMYGWDSGSRATFILPVDHCTLIIFACYVCIFLFIASSPVFILEPRALAIRLGLYTRYLTGYKAVRGTMSGCIRTVLGSQCRGFMITDPSTTAPPDDVGVRANGCWRCLMFRTKLLKDTLSTVLKLL